MKKYLPPLLWIFAYLAISVGIGHLTRMNMGWYETLEKSALTPPNIVFPIVWTGLYILLALAGWQVWSRRKQDPSGTILNLYSMQMFLNWGWSFVFFEFHQVLIGFLWIATLDFAMLSFIIYAWKANRPAALLVAPTLLWGCFAAYLNYAIWALN